MNLHSFAASGGHILSKWRKLVSTIVLVQPVKIEPCASHAMSALSAGNRQMSHGKDALIFFIFNISFGYFTVRLIAYGLFFLGLSTNDILHFALS